MVEARVPTVANGRPERLQSRSENPRAVDPAGGDTLTRRRSAARVMLLPTDCLADETASFDVLINKGYAGHWSETSSGRSAITWVGGEWAETDCCEGDVEKVIAVIRPIIPASRLEKTPTPSQYDVAVVEAVILEVVATRHPRGVTADELTREVVRHPGDAREAETAKRAIRGLQEVGLLRDGNGWDFKPKPAVAGSGSLTHRNEELVEPTSAGLGAVALLT